MGSQRLKAATTFTADAVKAVDCHLPVFLVTRLIHRSHVENPLAQPEGDLNTLGNPGPGGLPDDDAIHDHLHLVAASMVQRRGCIERENLPVHTDPVIALGTDLIPECFVGLPVVQLDRRHQVEPYLVTGSEHLVDHLVGSLGADPTLAVGTERASQSCQQDPEVIINFSDRADGRSWRIAQVLLFNGNRGRKSFDLVESWFLHLANELPGIGTQALHVSPLALGIDGIHGQ